MAEKQPRSDISRIARPVGSDDPRPLPTFTRYDLLLAAIGLLVPCAAVVGHVTSVLSHLASADTLSALPFLVDGLAIDPPA